ncbi:catalase [Desulfovibrio sp. OttesenSCG-928-A18]|nr:catalase [Desulfovibrio sp. OttesenSCG-928-A18]
MSKKNTGMTSSFGAPWPDDNTSLTAGRGGPVLMQDVALLEKLAHFDRERIPERVVHAKGAGAFGHFTATADVSKYSCADFLQKGKKTPVLARFSTVAGERGSADAERDPRGFAVKFYTEEGNYDLVGNNTPVFFIRDAMKFPDFIHSQKRRTADNLRSNNDMWDFWSLTPESLHQIMVLMSDRGVPASFRHMNGYGSHTFMWYNAKKEYFWVKYHFKTDQGIENLTWAQAEEVMAKDRDHATRDLYTSIANGLYPSWTVQVQIMTPEQARDFPYDPFDVTKVWPHGLVPVQEIGKMVLDRAPDNYFQQIEQAAFNPSAFVPGIAASPDKMLQGRLFSYHDTHLHRLGPNYHLIPVNQPKNGAARNYQRDGFHDTSAAGAGPNFWPNSQGGPAPQPVIEPPVPYAGDADRHVQAVADIDYKQPAVMYNKVMGDYEREQLVTNVSNHMNGGVDQRIKERSLVMFWKMEPDCAKRIAQLVGVDIGKVEKLAALSFEELVKATA